MFFGNWSLAGIVKIFLDYVSLHLHFLQKYEEHFLGSWIIMV